MLQTNWSNLICLTIPLLPSLCPVRIKQLSSSSRLRWIALALAQDSIFVVTTQSLEQYDPSFLEQINSVSVDHAADLIVAGNYLVIPYEGLSFYNMTDLSLAGIVEDTYGDSYSIWRVAQCSEGNIFLISNPFYEAKAQLWLHKKDC